MSYDIAMGLCSAVEELTVVVRLESAMLKRLLPEHPWRRNGVSLLRLPRSICSSGRVPTVGQELYVDHAALATCVEAALDLAGNGDFVAVDLRKLLEGFDPMSRPDPEPRHRVADYRTPHTR